MWAHYARSFAGFVIGLRTDNNFFRSNTNAFTLLPVNYASLRPLAEFDPAIAIEENGWLTRAVFFTKASPWAYESEWRMVRPLIEAEDKNLHLFSFPGIQASEWVEGTGASPRTPGIYRIGTNPEAGDNDRRRVR
jgi:hypothetical protein